MSEMEKKYKQIIEKEIIKNSIIEKDQDKNKIRSKE